MRSDVFLRVKKGKRVGSDLWGAITNDKGRHGTGINDATLRRWEREGWVNLVTKKEGRKLEIIGVKLTAKGREAA